MSETEDPAAAQVRAVRRVLKSMDTWAEITDPPENADEEGYRRGVYVVTEQIRRTLDAPGIDGAAEQEVTLDAHVDEVVAAIESDQIAPEQTKAIQDALFRRLGRSMVREAAAAFAGLAKPTSG